MHSLNWGAFPRFVTHSGKPGSDFNSDLKTPLVTDHMHRLHHQAASKGWAGAVYNAVNWHVHVAPVFPLARCYCILFV
jgi:hypothetical protein